jgi:FkbM family methyltransferase
MDFSFAARNISTSWSNRANIADFARRMLWIYSEKLPIALRQREWTIGFRYPLPVGSVRLLLRANGGADAFIHSEVFEHQYYRLPLQRSPATILDLGANIGLSAIYLARVFPNARLACVEPMSDNLRVLVANLKINAIQAEVISAAVDVRDGTVVMEHDVNDYGHKIEVQGSLSSAVKIEVPAISMPSILQRLGWTRIGLLKMDIEGHERRLLSESCDWLQCVDTMCLEYHEEYGETELARIASQFGFLAPQKLPGGIWLLTR